jgi:histidine phosphotransferase ChpT
MNVDSLNFTEVLNAKFCHDLAGLIGAINNSAEFLDSSDPHMQLRAKDLLFVTSNQLVNKLSFYRQAYGSLSSSGDNTSGNLKFLVDKYFEGSRISFEFPQGEYQSMTEIDVVLKKLILNAVAIVGNIMLHSGKIRLNFDNLEGPKKITIDGTPTGLIKLDSDNVLVVQGVYDKVEVTPRNVQFFYMRGLSDSGAFSLKLSASKEKVAFTITQE